jgi:hypothetical protein
MAQRGRRIVSARPTVNGGEQRREQGRRSQRWPHPGLSTHPGPRLAVTSQSINPGINNRWLDTCIGILNSATLLGAVLLGAPERPAVAARWRSWLNRPSTLSARQLFTDALIGERNRRQGEDLQNYHGVNMGVSGRAQSRGSRSKRRRCRQRATQDLSVSTGSPHSAANSSYERPFARAHSNFEAFWGSDCQPRKCISPEKNRKKRVICGRVWAGFFCLSKAVLSATQPPLPTAFRPFLK